MTTLYPLVKSGTDVIDCDRAVEMSASTGNYDNCLMTCYAACPVGVDCALKCADAINGKTTMIKQKPPITTFVTQVQPQIKPNYMWILAIVAIIILFVFLLK